MIFYWLRVIALLLHFLDPEEFLNLLFSQVLKVPPFLENTHGNAMHLNQLFVVKDASISSPPSVQELFNRSFADSKLKLKTIPDILILQMPRYGVKTKIFEEIIPTQQLDITETIAKGEFS